MLSFLSLIAAPAITQVSESGLFGKPYVRLGRLYVAIGSWVYQQGGALGYALQGHGDILGKILEAAYPQPAEYVESLRKPVEQHLRQVEGQEKTFYHLYIVRELRAYSIDLTAWPPSKGLDKKCDAEMASDVMRLSFDQGAGLGYHFPDTFEEYWANTYRLYPESEWQEIRAHGLALSETQQKRPLGTAVAELAGAAAEWAESTTPGLLSDSQISILKAVSGTADHKASGDRNLP